MKLNIKQTIYIGLAFLIISMFWQVYDNIISKMIIDAYGFNQFWSGIIMALDNVFMLFLLPLFGKLSDTTKTKYGKRTPYIFFGVILSAVLFVGVALAHNQQTKMIAKEGIVNIVENKDVNGEVISFEYKGQVFKVSEQTNGATIIEKIENTRHEASEVRRKEIEVISKNNSAHLISFIVILFFVLLVMSTYRTPAVALMPDVTPKPLRSKANAIINLMGAAGGVTSLIIVQIASMIKKAQGVAIDSSYILEFGVLAILMIGLLFIFLWKVKEPKLVDENAEFIAQFEEDEIETIQEETAADMPKDVKKSFYLILASIVLWFMAYNAATSKFAPYASQILDMGFSLPLLIAQVAAIIMFIPIGQLASKIGRKRTILIGLVILFVAFVLGTIANRDTKFLIYITMALAGIGWATINVNSYPMIVEMSKSSNIGKYTGYYYSASMFAQILTPVLSGAIMTYLFNNSMRPLFYYSAIFTIFAFITMSFVKHGDSKPIPVKDKLEAYDALDD